MSKTSLNTDPLDTLFAEVADLPEEHDGIPITDAKYDATYKLNAAKIAIRRLQKLTAG